MSGWELFEKQPKSYQEKVLGNVPRVSLEAASTFGWARWTGDKGINIGIDTFGQSAPGDQLFKHFGFTVDEVVKKIQKGIKK